MVNSKFCRSIAGVSVLFAAVSAHAQVLIEDAGKPPGTAAAPAQSAQEAKQARLQQGVMQSSTRQSGTQQTGMENGRFDKGEVESGVSQMGASQAGATQSGAAESGAADQAGNQKSDLSSVPAATERSRAAQDAQSGVTAETLRGRSGAAGSTAAGPGALNKTDTRSLVDMAMANMAEVEMGKLAQSKGVSEQVKTYGQQMIDDHGKALAEVQALAQAKGVSLPAELDAKHRKEAERLAAMSGAAFDKAYMERAGVRDHRAVHARLVQIEASARDPDVKALALKMRPVVQQHLTSARQMSKAKNTSKPDTASGSR